MATGADVTSAGPAHPYVSRGGVKLAAALDAFGYDPAGRVALDLGASTGGFTDVLLRRGANKVYAVDVGHGQLHTRLAGDPRVINLEGVHAKDLSDEHIPEPVEMIVCDVSFISLAKALPGALGLADADAVLAALVKPQFEVGRENIDKGGIVRHEDIRLAALAEVSDWVARQPGWRVDAVMDSPIEGGDGNKEFLLGATYTA